MSDRYRNGGFADASGADDGDEARGVQLRRQLQNVSVPANDSALAAGKIGVRKTASNNRSVIALTVLPRDRRDKAIAASGNCGDVARTVLAIAQRLAEARHVKSKAAFLHDDVGPDPRHQILLVDDFVRPGNQGNQDVEGRRPKLQGSIPFREELSARNEMER